MGSRSKPRLVLSFLPSFLPLSLSLSLPSGTKKKKKTGNSPNEIHLRRSFKLRDSDWQRLENKFILCDFVQLICRENAYIFSIEEEIFVSWMFSSMIKIYNVKRREERLGL